MPGTGFALRAATGFAAAGALAGVLTVACDTRVTTDQAGNRAHPGRDTVSPPEGAPAAAAPMSFTLTATGDVLAYPSIIEQARVDAGENGYDFRAILAHAAPLTREADLAICHMETPYGAPGGPFTGYPLFQVPPQVAQALADGGYDSCSTASNHSLDAGVEGLSRTLDTLDAAGVRHAGTARTEAESGPTLLDVKGVKVAHLSWTYDTNGIPLPADRPWAVNVIDRDRIIAQARQARAAGAEVVLLSIHWGTEWQREPDTQQLELARELTASQQDGRKDIDLILGTHNHVPQAYSRVNGTWVVYGMGNHVANFPGRPAGNQSTAARFTLNRDTAGRWTVSEAAFQPLHAEPGPPFRVVDVNTALADPAVSADRRAALEAARADIVEAVLSEGAGGDGLREAGRN